MSSWRYWFNPCLIRTNWSNLKAFRGHSWSLNSWVITRRRHFMVGSNWQWLRIRNPTKLYQRSKWYWKYCQVWTWSSQTIFGNKWNDNHSKGSWMCNGWIWKIRRRIFDHSILCNRLLRKTQKCWCNAWYNKTIWNHSKANLSFE